MQTCDLDIVDRAQQASEEDLLRMLDALTTDEHSVLIRVLVALGEIDHRRGWHGQASPSFFELCMSRFKYSEGQTYRRLNAARAIKKFPDLLPLFVERQISLTNLATISKRLTCDNHLELALEVGTKRRGDVEIVPRPLVPRAPRSRKHSKDSERDLRAGDDTDRADDANADDAPFDDAHHTHLVDLTDGGAVSRSAVDTGVE